MTGFIVMKKDALDHPLLKDGDRFRAWFWMLSRAAWKPTPFDVGGKVITLQRGQLCVSIRQLSDAFGMSKSTVERFLTRLKNETMIGTETGHGKLVITICNYAKYQDVKKKARDESGTPDGTPAGQERDTKEPSNHGTIVDEEANASPSKSREARLNDFPVPVGVDQIDWEGLLQNRKAKRSPMTDSSYRSIIKKLDAWGRDGWPPGPIMAEAAERGWTTVFETSAMKEAKNGNGNGNNRNGSGGNFGQRDNRNGFERACDRAIERAETEQRGDARIADDSQRTLALPPPLR